MKKILLGLCFVLVCHFANADVMFVNDIDAEMQINLDALDYAETKLSNKKASAGMMSYFMGVWVEGGALSVKDITKHCLTIDNAMACKDFVVAYVNYIGGNADDCSAASSHIGADHVFGAHGHDYKEYFKTFKEARSYCETNGHDTDLVNANGEVTHSKSYTLDSIYAVCKRFLENVKKCHSYLEVYYTKELESKKIKRQQREQYECILNLINTGQMDLPQSLMEEACKPE